MPLPAPNLDDRRFQGLVDDAKRLVQARCPEWTDHNVSDPGVTLIETFAFMMDQLLYRLNRVPDRNYVKFLDLIGVRLFPSTAARVDCTFWLAAPQPASVVVPEGSEVATPRGERTDSAVAFTTVEDLTIVPCERTYLNTILSGNNFRDHTEALHLAPVTVFSDQPEPGEVMLVGLSAAVPRCAVRLRMDCRIEGIGVDPDDPPLVWEAYNGDSWVVCELDKDTTGGLNRAGDVIVHVPEDHRMAVIQQLRAGWLRARVTAPEEGQPFYSSSPLLMKIDAETVGGTIPTVQAEVVENEVLGVCEGVPGQSFQLERAPMVGAGEPIVFEVSTEDGWDEWSEVGDFAGSGPEDPHFVLDWVQGELKLGPAVRLADGSLVQYGAVPPKGAVARVRRYRSGGGRRGNVARGTIKISRRTVPFVSRVENRHPASGGVDGETVEEAKVRGPISLRTLGRAVTTEDYEQLAHEAAPEAARVRAVPATTAEDAGGVRVLMVPAAADDETGRLPFEQLIPPTDMLETVAAYLDRRRTIGARVVVEPPAYQGVTVVAVLRPRSWVDPARLQTAATRELFHYLHPLSGGPDGDGWPFGRPVHMGEIFSVLQALHGTELVEDVRLFAADPITGERGQSTQRIEVAENALVFSYEHQVRVLERT